MLIGLSTVFYVVASFMRIVKHSTIITVSKRGKHVPIIGKINTLKNIIFLEPIFSFVDTLALNMVAVVIMGFSTQLLVMALLPTLSCLLVTVLSISLIR